MCGEKRERSANVDVVIDERVCQCALEAAEVVREVCEESLPVVTGKRLSREQSVLDSAPENRASEDDAAVLEKRLQICQDGGLCRWFSGEAVEDPVQRDRGETGGPEVERLEHARLDYSRRVALQAPRRLVQAGGVRVEKRDQRPFDRKAAAIQEKAGADADVEMRAADVSVVEVEEVPPWAPPNEAAREPQDG